MKARNRQSIHYQRGAALLIIMLLVLVAASAVFVTRLSGNELRSLSSSKSNVALAFARQALLDHAAVRPDMVFGQPVTLPCPDIDDSMGLDEGESHTAACGAAGVTVMGRFPWKTLGVRPPVDASAACLWYIVSGSWKNAGAGTAAMINADSNGQLTLWGIDAGAMIEGTLPQDRPAAMIVAPMQPLNNQVRTVANNRQCSDSFIADNFLDADSVSGIDNANLLSVADGIDTLAVAEGRNDDHNDRVVTISRRDIAQAIKRRPDYSATMRALGLAVAACVADYARQNSGGAADRRLPWPAQLQLADYRTDLLYDDSNGATISGRLPDRVDDSNLLTGNPIAQLLSACNAVSVPAWSPGMLTMWRHWKDHFYIVVAESHVPTSATPSNCVNCITVNGTGQYIGVVLFANSRLPALLQVRNAPPTDADTRDDIKNYLEAANTTAFPYTGGGLNLVSQAASNTFNDLLFCIDDTLAISEC